MLTRRNFLGFLSAVPLLGRLVPEPEIRESAKDEGNVLKNCIAYSNPRDGFYISETSLILGTKDGILIMETPPHA
jgi:hypothetical protein